MPTVLSKFYVTVRVFEGRKQLTQTGKLYKNEVPLQVVIDNAVATLPDGLNMTVEQVRSFNTESKFDAGTHGTLLDEDDLEELLPVAVIRPMNDAQATAGPPPLQ